MSAALPSSITGLVLAGGRGSRMGGVDKGLVDWHGQPLAARALERLRPQVGTMAINANRNQSLYASWGAPVWADEDETFAGPLAGLLAGLTRCRTEWLVTVPCDCPLFPHDLADRLSAAVNLAGTPLAMAATGSVERPEPQPVFLLVHTSLRKALATALAQGERRVGRWASAHRTAVALFDDRQSFANANTAEDLAALPAPG